MLASLNFAIIIAICKMDPQEHDKLTQALDFFDEDEDNLLSQAVDFVERISGQGELAL